MEKSNELKGACEHCKAIFSYQLIHNGFNDSAYAYCDSCGLVGFLSAWGEDIPAAANSKAHGAITEDTEKLLNPCGCGGNFSRKASPRCPNCRQPLDPNMATGWLEKNAPGAAKGWHWQRNWDGLYAIIIGNKSSKLEFGAH